MLGRQAGSNLLRLPIHTRLVLRPTAPFQSQCLPDLASRAFLLSSHRCYATVGRPRKAVGEPSKPVKRAVKKQAKSTSKSDPASKLVKAKKTTAGRPKTVGRPKKKAAPKKPAKKPAKKVLTDAQKARKAELAEKEKLKALKTAALSPPGRGATSAYTVFVAEKLKGASSGKQTERFKDASKEWKSVTPAEQEHYNHLAHQATETAQAEFKRWVESHAPEQIKQANNARAMLRRKLGVKATGAKYRAIADERQPKRPATGFILFAKNRQESGDFKNIAITERSKLIGKEWASLTESEKKKYKDLFAEDQSRYSEEFQTTYGHMPPFQANGVAAAAAAA